MSYAQRVAKKRRVRPDTATVKITDSDGNVRFEVAARPKKRGKRRSQRIDAMRHALRGGLPGLGKRR